MGPGLICQVMMIEANQMIFCASGRIEFPAGIGAVKGFAVQSYRITKEVSTRLPMRAMYIFMAGDPNIFYVFLLRAV